MKASPIVAYENMWGEKKECLLSLLGELLQLEDLPGPLLVDNMEDEVHSKFPFYLLEKNLVYFYVTNNKQDHQ